MTAPALRARILAAAAQLTAESGWSSVRMGRIAELIGVSRQTVYNEVYSKRVLTEQMVLTESAKFLRLVDDAFTANPPDPVAAIREACRGVLRFAADNAVLHAVVSASHGTDNDLLPLLTTRSDLLLDTVKDLVRGHLVEHLRHLPERTAAAVTDVLIRAVLSHVVHPSGTPEDTADDIALLAGHFLAR
ncbi:MAG: TetR family transcriptional regulator [Umezawaea sp.]